MRTVNIWSSAWADNPAMRSSSGSLQSSLRHGRPPELDSSSRANCQLQPLGLSAALKRIDIDSAASHAMIRPGDRRECGSRRGLQNGLSGFERECFGNIASPGAVLRSSCMGGGALAETRHFWNAYVNPEVSVEGEAQVAKVTSLMVCPLEQFKESIGAKALF